MAAQIALEIVTPEGVKLQEQVADVTAPSVEGEFGVMPGHRPLMAALAAGLVRYHVGSDEHVVAVGPGFVELHGDRATIITDKFLKKGEVDPVLARLELKEADEALDKYAGDPGSAEHRALIDREAWAAVQLELYGDPPPPKVRLGEFHVTQDVGVQEGVDVLATSSDAPDAKH